MTTCHRQASGAVELYFYGELETGERVSLERHLAACRDCRQALDDLHTIRTALASRPDIAAPDGGDWGPFMARLDAAVQGERLAKVSERSNRLVLARGRSFAGWVAMAACVATTSSLSIVVVTGQPFPRGRCRGVRAPGRAGSS